MFEESKFQGELTRRADEDFNSFLFETEIANEPSWFIVRKYDRGNDYLVYSLGPAGIEKPYNVKREPLIRRGTAIRVALKILFPRAKIQLFSKLATKK